MQQSLRPALSRTYLLPRPYLARKSARGHSPHAANSGAPAVSRRCSAFEWLAQSLSSVFPLAGKRCICSCMVIFPTSNLSLNKPSPSHTDVEFTSNVFYCFL
uniref:Uncharacterized protein n=1 Tax=Opuntia streptacantha TaxID=393608 RepID=A0A7C9E8B5_OPUST